MDSIFFSQNFVKTDLMKNLVVNEALKLVRPILAPSLFTSKDPYQSFVDQIQFDSL
jgi:hypothetical protein